MQLSIEQCFQGTLWVNSTRMCCHQTPQFRAQMLLGKGQCYAIEPPPFCSLPHSTLPFCSLTHSALPFCSLTHSTLPFCSLPHSTLPFCSLQCDSRQNDAMNCSSPTSPTRAEFQKRFGEFTDEEWAEMTPDSTVQSKLPNCSRCTPLLHGCCVPL